MVKVQLNIHYFIHYYYYLFILILSLISLDEKQDLRGEAPFSGAPCETCENLVINRDGR